MGDGQRVLAKKLQRAGGERLCEPGRWSNMGQDSLGAEVVRLRLARRNSSI